MGASENRTKNAAMAAHLVKRGFPHGKRATSARPNSGSTTGVNRPGSSKFHRREDSTKGERRG